MLNDLKNSHTLDYFVVRHYCAVLAGLDVLGWRRNRGITVYSFSSLWSSNRLSWLFTRKRKRNEGEGI